MSGRNYGMQAEVINRLYQARFRRQAPGHDEPAITGRDASDDENRAQYAQWLGTGQAWCDALEALYRAQEDQAALIDSRDEFEVEASRLRTRVAEIEEAHGAVVRVVEAEHAAQAIGFGHATVRSFLCVLKAALGEAS